MGDKATLAKARQELEELYEGIPDESVNLTFQYLADVKQMKKEAPTSELVVPKGGSPLSKLPSLDFNRGLQGVRQNRRDAANETFSTESNRSNGLQHCLNVDIRRVSEAKGGIAYDDVSGISMTSMHHDTHGRRRPGIPHSKICTVCSTYIYIFRHRCLVCGRVYCRQCLNIGMGEMTEGRKCIQCLGRKFSHRYIGRAGEMGCCGWRYSSMVKQEELKWAEKGPRRKAERGYSRSPISVMSTSAATPTPPIRVEAAAFATSSTSCSPHSFIMSSSYSPYSPTNRHRIPF